MGRRFERGRLVCTLHAEAPSDLHQCQRVGYCGSHPGPCRHSSIPDTYSSKRRDTHTNQPPPPPSTQRSLPQTHRWAECATHPLTTLTQAHPPRECGRDLRQPFLPNASTAADQPTASPMFTVEICIQGQIQGAAVARRAQGGVGDCREKAYKLARLARALARSTMPHLAQHQSNMQGASSNVIAYTFTMRCTAQTCSHTCTHSRTKACTEVNMHVRTPTYVRNTRASAQHTRTHT